MTGMPLERSESGIDANGIVTTLPCFKESEVRANTKDSCELRTTIWKEEIDTTVPLERSELGIDANDIVTT